MVACVAPAVGRMRNMCEVRKGSNVAVLCAEL